MKTFSLLARLIASAAALSPLLLATAALAGAPTTYSNTEQSVLVQQALSALRSGDQVSFAASLDEQAKSRFASESGARRLRARLEARALSGSTLNFKSEVSGRIQPDTLLVVSHRVYTVEVQSTAQAPGQFPEALGKFTVRCMGLSFLDSFGGTQRGCRITDISTPGSEHSELEARSLAGTHSKILSDETVAPVTAPAQAGAARVQNL